MDQDFPESSLNGELQTESLRDLKLDQDLHCSLDQVQVQDKDSTQDEAELDQRPPEPPQDQLEEQALDQNPTEHDGDRGRPAQDQDLLRAKQSQDQDRAGNQGHQDQDRARYQGHQDQDRARRQGHQDQDQDRAGRQGHQDQDLTTDSNQGVGGDGVPALVITQAEEALGPEPAGPVGRAMTPADPVMDPGLSSSSDGGDMTCSDLLSLMSEPAVCRTSEDDDSRSVTASSVMSLFHRVQLDPLEKFWLRSSAVGNMAAQRQLLSQDSSLVYKKDFITGTALHWAAKQGRQDSVDLMLHSGADVNARSHGGYTALHLASIHGHQHVVHALINTYNAKTTIRDYHGKTADQYASCSNNKPEVQSGGRGHHGRQSQRSVLPSLLSRSRSQGQLTLDFVMTPQSHDGLDF